MNEETPVDEFHGVGGAYVIDPETGKRVPEKAPAPAMGPSAGVPQGHSGVSPLPSPVEKSGRGSSDNVVELAARKPKSKE